MKIVGILYTSAAGPGPSYAAISVTDGLTEENLNLAYNLPPFMNATSFPGEETDESQTDIAECNSCGG